jgi:hypothetical protein
MEPMLHVNRLGSMDRSRRKFLSYVFIVGGYPLIIVLVAVLASILMQR